jgi:YggT family protein
MQARHDIAQFLSALITVYTLIIFAWIIISWVLSFGVRIPYSRPVNAVLDFLRDVTNPFLRIFGPVDFSPIVAILVLQFGGRLLVSLIDPGP